MNQIIADVRLSHRFARHWALVDVALCLHEGELLLLTGPNGCGKTTLLKILATLLLPTLAEGQMFEKCFKNNKEEIRKKIGWLGHQTHLYPHLTGIENLNFFLGLQNKKEECHLIGSVLERVGLGVSYKFVSEYSTGMKKRLVLAKLLLQAPSLILMDEPHANLDEGGKKLLNELISGWKKEGKTLVIASHDCDEVSSLADRVSLLKEGRL